MSPYTSYYVLYIYIFPTVNIAAHVNQQRDQPRTRRLEASEGLAAKMLKARVTKNTRYTLRVQTAEYRRLYIV